jgi:putative hydrolase of the HAD superfamily
VSIRAVIFDFGGVLAFHPTREQVRAAALDCGFPPDQFAPLLWKRRLLYDAGKIDAGNYWRDVFESNGKTFEPARLRDFIRHEIGFWSRYDQRVFDWINQLRGSGFRTGILSNLPVPIGEHLRATPGFLDHFDHVTFSYELLSAKPEPAIYRHAIEGQNVTPEETLFLDDRPENIAGARDLGMNAELYESWEKFAPEVPARYTLPLP